MTKAPSRRWAGGLLAAALCVAACAPAVAAQSGWVRARAVSYTPHYRAYARVAPVRVVRVRAGRVGVVAKLAVRPGDTVSAGQQLARLGGAQAQALVARRRSAVGEAQAQLAAARETLAAERQKRQSHLSTQQQVAQARAALAKARGQLASARASLAAARSAARVQAPVAGTVLALAAADGERVSAGDTLLTLLPAHGLWVKASYYGPGAAAVTRGMHGRFEPADGSAPVAVTVRSVFAVQQAGGGRTAALTASAAQPGWVNGEAGSVTLQGEPQRAVVVPSRALVLDQGRWWVLVHAAHGARRQAVVPGPSRGENTVIRSGLKAGQQVLATHAYLTFHRGVSEHYEPPD